MNNWLSYSMWFMPVKNAHAESPPNPKLITNIKIRSHIEPTQHSVGRHISECCLATFWILYSEEKKNRKIRVGNISQRKQVLLMFIVVYVIRNLLTLNCAQRA